MGNIHQLQAKENIADADWIFIDKYGTAFRLTTPSVVRDVYSTLYINFIICEAMPPESRKGTYI